MSSPFYEFQLFVLATFCVAAVAFERRVKGDPDASASSHSKSDSTSNISGIENGNGHSGSQTQRVVDSCIGKELSNRVWHRYV